MAKLALLTLSSFIISPIPSFAGTIVFTEQSSTVLTATMNGAAFGSVSCLSPDTWIWLLPTDRPSVFSIQGGSGSWLEPDSTADQHVVNHLDPLTADNNRVGFGITSDTYLSPLIDSALANDSVASNFVSFTYNDGSSETFNVQFNDLGDSAAVPEGGSTLGLLALSMLGLFGMARLRFWPAS